MRVFCLGIDKSVTFLYNSCIRTMFCGILALSFFLIQGCGDKGSDDSGSGGGLSRTLGLTPPPVSITFRESLYKGYVLQLHNRSNQRVVTRVFVENKAHGQTRSTSVGIDPNSMEELGMLEMNWVFMPGENGHVSVDGYTRDLNFELSSDGQYKVW